MHNFSSFLKIVYPDQFVKYRKDKGPIWKLSKWLGIRVAFIFYKMKISANLLDISLLCLAPFFLYLVTFAQEGYRLLPIIGIIFLFFHTFIDFVDGSLARARNEVSLVGDALDDIGPDLIRFIIILIFAIFTENILIMIGVFIAMYILVFFTNDLLNHLSGNRVLKYLNTCYQSPLSPISARIILIFPILLVFSILMLDSLIMIGYIVSIFYILLSFSLILNFVIFSKNDSFKVLFEMFKTIFIAFMVFISGLIIDISNGSYLIIFSTFSSVILIILLPKTNSLISNSQEINLSNNWINYKIFNVIIKALIIFSGIFILLGGNIYLISCIAILMLFLMSILWLFFLLRV